MLNDCLRQPSLGAHLGCFEVTSLRRCCEYINMICYYVGCKERLGGCAQVASSWAAVRIGLVLWDVLHLGLHQA